MNNKKKIAWWYLSGYTPSAGYQAILDRATALGYTKPSAALIVKQDTLYRALDALGFWTASNLYYQFQTGDSNLKNFSKLNWKSPSTFELQEISSPVYDGTGWKSAGAGSYLDTQWDTSTNGGGIYTQNNAGWLCDILTNQNVDQWAFGSCIAALDRIVALQPRHLNTKNWGINRNVYDFVAETDGSGLVHAGRTASTTAAVSNNGTEDDSDASTSRLLSTQDIYILALNNNGTAGNFYLNNIGCFGIGASTYSNRVAIYNAIAAYKASL